MKQPVIGFLISLLLYSCHSTNKQSDSESTVTNTSVSDSLLQQNSVSNMVALNHTKLEGVKGNYTTFKIYIDSLDKTKMSSIALALDYINTCIPVSYGGNDSVYTAFREYFYTVINPLTDSLNTQYYPVIEQIEHDSVTEQVRAFRNNLAACGVALLSTEGMNYLDEESDYFFEHFKNRVAKDTRSYLEIRKDELKEGFSEDAGLLISFEDVYNRAKRWEKFMDDYRQSAWYPQANGNYTTYVETLMTGMDNSRVFDFDDAHTLLPEIKTLYEKISKEQPGCKTSKLIASYYSFLAKYDFKETDSVDVFLQQNNLSTMLAVQPRSR